MSKRLKTKQFEMCQRKDANLVLLLFELQIIDSNCSSNAESDATCPKCRLLYSKIGGLWVFCCNQWFDMKCTATKKKQQIPEHFFVIIVWTLGLSRMWHKKNYCSVLTLYNIMTCIYQHYIMILLKP